MSERIKENLIKNKSAFNFKNKSNSIINLKERFRLRKTGNKASKNRKDNTIFIILFIIITDLLIPNLSDGFIVSKITLKINGIGYKKVFTSNVEEFNNAYYPNEIYINGIKQEAVSSNYYLNQSNNLVELIWKNSIDRPVYMFLGCSDITEIDLSHFDTSQNKNCRYMFTDCTSLTSLNLTNFDTSQVTHMYDMFRNCKSLTSLDLSCFDTSKVENMQNMFNGCESLSSLNLSNFVSSELINMVSFLSGCISLEYINLKNFNGSKRIWADYFFKGVPDNIVICTNDNNFILDLLDDDCYALDCSNDWKLNQKKIDSNSNKCIKSCDDSSHNKFEYNGKCYKNCQFGNIFFDNNTITNECKCELEYCLLCPPVALNKKLCTKCNENYYPIENDPSNIGEYFKCYSNPQGYYLDKNDLLYKKCYHTCATCEMQGDNINHNCLSCKNDYPKKIDSNCYINCTYYYFFDSEYNYYCTLNSSCPKDYSKLIEDKMECVKDDDINNFQSTEIMKEEEYLLSSELIIPKQNNSKIIDIKNMIDDIIINNYGNQTEVKNETKLYDTILDAIENAFTSENYDTTNIDSGEDQIIEQDKIKITLTSTQNLKNNINRNNMTIIDLEECETILRTFYNISENETLYMKKIDVIQEGMKIPKIEYDVYYKLYSNNLTKLNLSLCENTKISLSVPVIITESLDKLNTSSDYYNDKCSSSKSESGTDITLKDRQAEFIEGNKTVCQDNCDFSFYDSDNQKANCSCNVKESSSSYNDMKINNTKLYENFGDINNKPGVSSLGITSCNVLSSTDNIESNAGFYLLLLILALFIVVFIIFCKRGYNSLENKFDEIIYKKFENKESKNNKIKNSTIKRSQIQGRNGIKIKKKKKKKKKGSSKQIKYSDNIILNKDPNKNGELINITSVKEIENQSPKTLEESIIKPDTDYEFNWLSYEDALKYDKRTKCDYYSSLLRSKQLFIFTFCTFNDYNSGVIKKFMFFLAFALHYTVNALFFDESNIHQIYKDEGKFNFGYQIPYIIGSAVISTLALRLMLQFLILTDKDLLEVKLQQTIILAENMKKQKLKNIKIKFAIFFVLNFILLPFFWYYLTCFNAVYKNTQVYLIENTLISFGFSLVYPFIINISPTVIRIRSIQSSKKDQRCLYKTSQIFQII